MPTDTAREIAACPCCGGECEVERRGNRGSLHVCCTDILCPYEMTMPDDCDPPVKVQQSLITAHNTLARDAQVGREVARLREWLYHEVPNTQHWIIKACVETFAGYVCRIIAGDRVPEPGEEWE